MKFDVCQIGVSTHGIHHLIIEAESKELAIVAYEEQRGLTPGKNQMVAVEVTTDEGVPEIPASPFGRALLTAKSEVAKK